MADKEDESNMTAGAVEEESSSANPLHGAVGLAPCGDPVVSENTHDANGKSEEPNMTVKNTTANPDIPEYFQVTVQEGTALGQDGSAVSPLAGDGLASEHKTVTSFVETTGVEAVPAADLSAVSSELVNCTSPATTTIIYVQPDGSFVEGSGLTEEEQRQLVEQLAQQKLVEVSENEAARLFQQQRAPASHFTHGVALAPSELQQVIDQVSRSQQSVTQVETRVLSTPAPVQAPVTAQPPACIALPPGCVLAAGSSVQDPSARPAPLCIVQNASQQLQNVAKQVALQQNQSNDGTRLIPKKQVETVRIQVPVLPAPQEATPTSAPTLTLLQQRPAPSTGHAPQIIHITPVIGQQQQQFLLANPGEPPIQLVLQRPAPVVGGAIPVLHKVPARQTPVIGRPSPASLRPHGAEDGAEAGLRAALQKVQTRSGRVSRPPKHKVRDYKFIKTEDLADGRQSDSDDYSEISVDEEGKGEDENGNPKIPATSSVNVYVSPRSFHCQSCDKAYIGLGGLTRHYRLNPSHKEVGSTTQAAPPPETQMDSPAGRQAELAPSSASTNQSPAHPEKPSPLVPTEEKKSDLPRHQVALASTGPGRPRGRTGRPRSTHPVRSRRPGRPPKNLGDLQAPQRRARLKEVLQACEDEELMEAVLPRLAGVMTLWEFLLMKVDKGRPSGPQFSDVYREFEQLHAKVKKMAQEHMSAPPRPGPLPVLDVRDPQVFQSLGFGQLVTRLKMAPSEKPAVLQESDPASKTTGPREDCKALPPAKRFKGSHSNTEPNGTLPSQDRTGPTTAGSVSQTPPQDCSLVTTPMEVTPHPQNAVGSPWVRKEISTEGAGATEPAGSASSHAPGEGSGNGVELNGCDITDQILSSDVVPQDHTYRALSQTEHAQTPTQPAEDTEHAQNHPVTELPGHTEHAQSAALTEHAQQPSSTRPEGQAASQGGSSRQISGSPAEVFIQTSEGGLILPAGVLASASDRIVIVTNPDGTAMHIRSPDTVPLETVLSMDTGVQAEGVLVSEPPLT
ncbi:hypothetical protein GJAV_G00001070 [Gymnothorax javanicus]|nr:hypothetical protein GJAV_G00001070 [Gymnothorax javanicus]